MELDIELCRKILQKIEKEGGLNGLECLPRIEGYSDDLIYYQIKKMNEAGFTNGGTIGMGRSAYEFFEVEITYQGHSFLKQMLNDNIWNKTKEVAKKGGLELTLESVKQIIPFVYQTILNNLGH